MSLSSAPLILTIIISTFSGFIPSTIPCNLKAALDQDGNGRIVPVCRKHELNGLDVTFLTKKLAAVVSSLDSINAIEVTLLNSNESNTFIDTLRVAAYDGFRAVHRQSKAFRPEDIFAKAGITISSSSGNSDLDEVAVEIKGKGMSSTPSIVIGTVGSTGLRQPTMLSLNGFVLRGGVELNDHVYIFSCATSPCIMNGVMSILIHADVNVLESKLSEANGSNQTMIVIRGLGENKGILGKEQFSSLNGITILTALNFQSLPF
ncbi:uncharacterized protein LOC110861879 isoform X2 [Folsomia candida]|uniref:uncharacterized protein LOC110861879 isoform X2 n=1 Tax=Folsomia candida TaxID=158441 RepID=UPI000B9033A5|nr:uncharacterized protein LOC110861879 isoform X2 [Folsomia candida]